MTRERWLALSSLTRPFSRRDGLTTAPKRSHTTSSKILQKSELVLSGFLFIDKKNPKTKQSNNIRTSQMTKPLMKTIP